MMMMKLKMKQNEDQFSWSNISIEKYYEIKDVLYSDDVSDLEKEIKIISIITGMSTDEIESLPFSEYGILSQKLAFLNKFDLVKISDKIVVGDRKFDIITDPTKINVAQFVDYQNFVKLPLKDGFTKILSVFLIPCGKKYNEGYDIVELQNYFWKNTPFVVAQSILNFIMTKYIESSLRSLKYLVKNQKMNREQILNIMKAKIQTPTI